jgi:hypothetical protein
LIEPAKMSAAYFEIILHSEDFMDMLINEHYDIVIVERMPLFHLFAEILEPKIFIDVDGATGGSSN